MEPPRSGLDGVSRFFGIRWESATHTRMPIRPELINAGGMLSGVATYALVDYTMGSALWKETAEDEAIATVNISINYVRTAVQIASPSTAVATSLIAMFSVAIDSSSVVSAHRAEPIV